MQKAADAPVYSVAPWNAAARQCVIFHVGSIRELVTQTPVWGASPVSCKKASTAATEAIYHRLRVEQIYEARRGTPCELYPYRKLDNGTVPEWARYRCNTTIIKINSTPGFSLQDPLHSIDLKFSRWPKLRQTLAQLLKKTRTSHMSAQHLNESRTLFLQQVTNII